MGLQGHLPELVIILILGLLILGPGKLPQVGGAVGKTIREFRKASTEGEGEEPVAADDQAAKVTTPVATIVTPPTVTTTAPAPAAAQAKAPVVAPPTTNVPAGASAVPTPPKSDRTEL